MKLKVLTIDVDIIRRTLVNFKDILDGRVLEENYTVCKRFYAFKHIIESESNDHGVLSQSGTMASLEDRLATSGDKLIKCRFVVVDTISKYVYYDGNQKDIKIILEKLFQINHNNILFIADIEAFYKLKQLKITTIPYGQIATDDDVQILKNQSDMISDLCEDGSNIASTVYEVNFIKEGAFFKKDEFEKITSKSKKGLISITAKGFDKDGNEVKLSSKISKEITVLPNVSTWGDKLNLQLNVLINALNVEGDE
ncbi:hypothetical protein PT106_01580 [Erysipelothrix rhusiopathiae]|nr:hypothetical protein [Erysipelothrix rhusiopathiae]